ncbi:MAG: nitroreductase family protein, partial [Bacteroidales bacterium]|nr:nitroreductase family protein [Bacteroidales bacterium]
MKRILIIVAAVLSAAACCPKQGAEKSAIDVIMSRKSVRSYTQEAIPSEKVEILLKAAMAAPTAMNVQPWRFVVVTDQAVKD